MKNDERMISYYEIAKIELSRIPEYSITQVSRSKNTHADSLASLASAVSEEGARSILVDYLVVPSITSTDVLKVHTLEEGPSWMDEVIDYLKNGNLPENQKEAHKLRIKSARFWLSPEQKLYRHSFFRPYLRCVHPDLVQDFLFEIHEGSCGVHT